MRVIGTVGLNGSGKDALLDYLHERCGIPVLSSGDIARELADQEGLEPTRTNLHDISQLYIARYGPRFFMKRVIEQIDAEQHNAVGITGVRTPADVETLRDHYGEHLLLVHVSVPDPRVRFVRTLERGKPRDPDTYERFLELDRKEIALFDLDETFGQADLIIPNDGTLEAFYHRIEEQIIAAGLLGDIRCDQ